MGLNLKLKSVSFENFRLFEKLDMDFHPQVTVLIGENGAGKTALVEGVAKMLMPVPKRIEKNNISQEDINATQRNVFKKADVTIGKNELSGEIALENSYIDEEFIVESTKLPIDTIEKLFHQFHFKGEKFLNILNEKRSIKAIKSVPILVYYKCEKTDDIILNGNSNLSEDTNIFNAYNNALNGKSIDFQSFLDWYKWQEDKELRGSGTSVLKIVREAILSMLNDKKGNENFTNLFIDVSSFKNYKLKIVKKDFELDFEQLSSGERSLLALIADIARRIAIANPDSDDPLTEGGGIVIIDEIDLHLHPRWQRKIIGKLTEIFPNLQFIITTHSPLILGSVRSENIRLLDEGQVYSVPETLGQNVGTIIKNIMGVEESVFEKEINQIFRHLAKNQVGEAKAGIVAIEQESPADIPDLREAKAILKRKEMLAE